MKDARFRTLFRTSLALGPINICRVALYRLSLKTRIARVCRIKFPPPSGPFFKAQPSCRPSKPVSAWRNRAHYFGWHTEPLAEDSPPDWHRNPFSGVRFKKTGSPWWRLPDFDPEFGDIKIIWELSRYDWVLAMAQRAITGETEEWDRLNHWLQDGLRHNPPYLGPNWKCGQEASIRVMHLAMAALIGHQEKSPCSGLLDLVEAHLVRIAPTIHYAVGQDNNHGTSEAAALFIGGSWLAHTDRSQGKQWERLGRKWLENRVRRLIEPEGSFSQYSTNYHRLMLDTLCMAEVWRQKLGREKFSTLWYERANAAARWLAAFTDPATGGAPNLGANDGARLLPLTDTDYRDFRPTVQLATVLFARWRTYTAEGPWDEPLRWLGVDLPEAAAEPQKSDLFNDGGYAVLRRGGALAMLRYPRFRFRPSHADGLHLDLWMDGENLLRDGGTYSYAEESWLDYFSGTAAHNTVQFDDRDQMPKLGRFLFGDWLTITDLGELKEDRKSSTFHAGYRDRKRAFHTRRVCLEDGKLIVQDQIGGFRKKAVLRWRLMPGAWQKEGNSVTNGRHRLTIKASIPLTRCDLVRGWESLYYLKKRPVPVFEIETRKPGVLISEYCWMS